MLFQVFVFINRTAEPYITEPFNVFHRLENPKSLIIFIIIIVMIIVNALIITLYILWLTILCIREVLAATPGIP
jgi:hypothetical protein